MTRCVNLMSPQAQLRSLVERVTRGWAIVVVALIAGMLAAAAWAWNEQRQIVSEHDALEARYEPIRRLAGVNRKLRADAAELVAREALALELGRRQSVASLMAVINHAVTASAGEAYVEHMNLTRPPVAAEGDADNARLILDVVSRPGYDISQFTESLRRSPVWEARATAAETISESGVMQTHHTIECILE